LKETNVPLPPRREPAYGPDDPLATYLAAGKVAQPRPEFRRALKARLLDAPPATPRWLPWPRLALPLVPAAVLLFLVVAGTALAAVAVRQYLVHTPVAPVVAPPPNLAPAVVVIVPTAQPSNTPAPTATDVPPPAQVVGRIVRRAATPTVTATSTLVPTTAPVQEVHEKPARPAATTAPPTDVPAASGVTPTDQPPIERPTDVPPPPATP
jgi:hypothetical protein